MFPLRAGTQSVPPEPTIKSTVHLIQIAVQAVNKSGSPMDGLTRNDFQIIENGVPRPIAFFQTAAAAGGVRERDAGPALAVFSNRPHAPGSHNCSVLLVDQLETDPGTWRRAEPDVRAFLKKLGPADRLAVFVLTPQRGLQVMQNCGANASASADKLPSARAANSDFLFRAPLSAAPETGELLQRPEGLATPELVATNNAQDVTNALRAIAGYLSGVDGNRSLIWFSRYFPNAFQREPVLTLEQARLQLLKAVHQLVAANVAIFPVDAHGLTPDQALDVEHENLPIPHPSGPTTAYPLAGDDFSDLMDLARESGGKAYFNTNGFAQSMSDALRLGTGRYTLGFYAEGTMDNRFHHIRIEVKQADVRLTYKPGYWAVESAPKTDADEQLRAALASPFPATDIQLQADGLPSPRKESVTLYIDSANVQLTRGTATLDVMFGQREPNGRVFAIAPDRVSVPLKTHPAAHDVWLTTHANIALRPQSTSIRVVVRDVDSGRIGSIDIPVPANR